MNFKWPLPNTREAGSLSDRTGPLADRLSFDRLRLTSQGVGHPQTHASVIQIPGNAVRIVRAVANAVEVLNAGLNVPSCVVQRKQGDDVPIVVSVLPLRHTQGQIQKCACTETSYCSKAIAN